MHQITRTTLLAALVIGLPIVAKANNLQQHYMKLPSFNCFSSEPCMTPCWSGFYLGANAGVVVDVTNATDTWNWTTHYPIGSIIGIDGGSLITTTTPMTFNTQFFNKSQHAGVNVIGGPEVGYNLQIGRMGVIGIEGDWSWSNVNNSTSYSAQPTAAVFPPLPNFFFIQNTNQSMRTSEELKWLSTLRARFGLANKSTFWYLTGGAAFGRVDTGYQLSSTPGFSGNSISQGSGGPGTGAKWGMPGGGSTASFSQNRVGYTVGGGVETNLGEFLGMNFSRWSMKLEYLFVDLGQFTNTFNTSLVPLFGTTIATTNQATGTTQFTSDRHVYDHMVRLGINYKLF